MFTREITLRKKFFAEEIFFFAEGIFCGRNFLRKEFFAEGIFCGRNFSDSVPQKRCVLRN